MQKGAVEAAPIHMKTIVVLIASFGFLWSPALADHKADSLYAAWLKADEGGKKATLNYQLAYQYYTLGDIEKALQSLELLTSQPTTNEILVPKAKAHYLQGYILNNERLYWESYYHFYHCVELFAAVNDEVYTALSFEALGAALAKVGMLEDAETAYQQALSFFLKADDKPNLSRVYHHMGSFYRENEEYEKAHTYYQMATTFLDKNSNDYLKIMIREGVLLRRTGHPEKALDLFAILLENAREKGDILSISMIINNQGIVYRTLGKYHQAQQKFEEALQLVNQIDPWHHEEVLYTTNLADVALLQKDYGLAIQYLEAVLKLSSSLNDPGEALRAFQVAGEVFQEDGFYDSYPALLAEYKRILDQIQEQQKAYEQYQMQKLVAFTRHRLVSEKAIAKAEESGHQAWYWAGVVVFVLLVLGALWALFQWRTRKHLKKHIHQLSQEKEALAQKVQSTTQEADKAIDKLMLLTGR